MNALLDEMMPPAIAEQLRAKGHDVIAVAERSDLRSLPDRDVVTYARQQDRVVVTRDRADYLAIDDELRAAQHAHAGLVLISSRFAETAIGPLVTALDELLSGDPPYPSFVHWL